MSTSNRQNRLLLNQDWKRIYQTFRNADFKSYDFENLRRVIISYLRENYPEDFNDYIESSEYLALIDAIAFLGQSLAFRIDLASRENFIELAERRDSVLRLARMLSYNPKRNIPASGLLKFDNISTTEGVLDGNGRNLAQQTIVWNDPTNPNWVDQFVRIMNSAMADNTEFGRSQGTAFIQGIRTDQYRFRTISTDIPIFSFSKIVSGRQMAFELMSTTFKGAEEIYEEPPVPGNQLGFIYKDDGRGSSSVNTGFYLMFKQGSLEVADFNIDIPTTNEVIAIDTNNVNNDDVWLYSLNSQGLQTNQWAKVTDFVGNNISYNSLTASIRNIYSVITKENDRIDLAFADGVYGNLPQGNFRVYYRVSNGLLYQISPVEMRGISITIPYLNKQGILHNLTIGLSLKYTVNSSSPAESLESIRVNAPSRYYTQNRMITGEDYNLAPLSSSQDILKVRAVNRISSGISRNFDIIDATGKYSNVNVFADDGVIYREDVEESIFFKFVSRAEIFNFIKEKVEPIFTRDSVYNFYITKFNKILFADSTTVWNTSSTDVNATTGYFLNSNDGTVLKTGAFSSSILRYAVPGALIKFTPPVGKSFKNGELVSTDVTDYQQTDILWTKIVNVIGDGTLNGQGTSVTTGPITFSDLVPTGSIASQIVPKFVNNLSDALEQQIINLMFSNLNFGLRYDITEQTWKLISSTNINLVSTFSLGKTGDLSNSNLDSSWILAFIRIPDGYVVRIRSLDYIFRSIEQNRFYYDNDSKTYDRVTGKVVKDQISVLGINTSNQFNGSLKQDIKFQVSDVVRYDDGYESNEEIKIAFFDSDDDGVIDNPNSFDQIVPTDDRKYIFFKKTVDDQGNIFKEYIDNSNNEILVKSSEDLVNINDAEFTDNRLVYFSNVDEDVVKRVDKSTNTFVLESEYLAVVGRDRLKFQYTHAASVDRRIDPSVSNIIDVYLLTRSYDTSFRNYLSTGGTEPEPPNSDDLRIKFGGNLNPIKAISDELIFHTVRYKILFGANADTKLQATFKVVKNLSRSINDNDLKVRIVSAINNFFSVNNWDFGDVFYASELITYITNVVAPDISNIVLVPKQPNQAFGSLLEIRSNVDEIFVNGATVDDIEIVTTITASDLRVSPQAFISSTN